MRDEYREADRIAADFAAISFSEHEARILAFAYLKLRRMVEEPGICATCGDSLAPLILSAPADEAKP